MSMETVISVRWKPEKFKQIKGDLKRSEIAERTGVSEVFWGKLISGDRKLSIESLEEFCVKTNCQPNDFFEIITKKE